MAVQDRAVSLNAVNDILDYWYSLDSDYQQVYKNINELLPIAPQPQWISVSERLPKEHLCNDGYVEPSDYVLVWGDHGDYGVSRYWGNRHSKSKLESLNTRKDWVDLDWVVQNPIAWMPLPKPYEPQE